MQHTLSQDAAANRDGPSDPGETGPAASGRAPRLKPGERRVLILQTLAAMLESPKSEKITTAALAARLVVSEAALYRHFASKAQMFEGLIEFIEQTVFGLINQITSREENGVLQVRAIVTMLLGFAEKNPGMTRVLTGEALVGEHERLNERINQTIDRIEASIRQCLKLAVSANDPTLPSDYDAPLRANLATTFVLGRWQRYAKTGFVKAPGDHADAMIRIILQ
ncbi:nucleoid occlusion factor SlmA [Pararobbsia silviterrae]|uniref:Nucleoid occlusion factor SlmA n=1 Tax=Pararobbsia silviterrae TaxID=1792498 RepID=A0A494Y7F2_9BURK|nr:nucleoid occlusion factor SlmA [Pararobbsia silviterrae]RKP58574.1 nucleoid occlusion factor SlmA [Pararobbsia silviterrae]